jgi:uncharacterized membrane protein YphA (DoxX/SURF4 family)
MVSRRLVVLARIYIGVIFLVAAYGKLSHMVDFAGPMTDFLSGVTLAHGYGFYANFVRAVVLPNAHVFAALVIAAEVCIAVAMLFGLATRAAAGVAIFLLANYMLAKGAVPWSPGSNDAADIVLCLIILLGAGGRTFGIDATLHKRFPKVPLW